MCALSLSPFSVSILLPSIKGSRKFILQPLPQPQYLCVCVLIIFTKHLFFSLEPNSPMCPQISYFHFSLFLFPQIILLMGIYDAFKRDVYVWKFKWDRINTKREKIFASHCRQKKIMNLLMKFRTTFFQLCVSQGFCICDCWCWFETWQRKSRIKILKGWKCLWKFIKSSRAHNLHREKL